MRHAAILWIFWVAIQGLPQLSAADFSLTLGVEAAYDESFMPVPIPNLTTQSDPVVLQIDFDVHVSNLAPNELGLGAVAFRYHLEGGVSDPTGGFYPNPMIPPPDYIVLVIPPPNSVYMSIPPRITNPNIDLGSMFLLYNPHLGPGRLALSPVYFAANSTAGTLLPFSLAPDVELRFGVVPEPSTAWLALAGLVWIVRRTPTRYGI